MTISFNRAMLAGCALAALTACDEPLDFDLRGLADGFNTSQAAIEARTTPKPQADANGIVSYPNYQVVIAQRGDTIASVAARTGLSTSELARYNGIPEDVTLRAGEIIALPRRVDNAAPIQSGTIATGEQIDVTSLASQALDEAESGTTTSTTTTQMTQADPSDPIEGMEPVRHQVQRGETAYSIARKYGISVRALADWNGLDANLSVQEGRYLLIPVKASDAPAQDSTPPGQGSVTPTPPSAAEPLPDPEAAAPAPTQSEPAADLGATQSSTR